MVKPYTRCMDTLVICIGNKARGDDGAARRTAELLEGRLPDNTKLTSRPQLDIVMTDDLHRSGLVVFVDAERRDAPGVRIDALAYSTDSGSAPDAHALTPMGLLSLTAALYGDAPPAHLVSIAAPQMPHAEGLSDTAKTASEEAVFAVIKLLGDSQ